MNDASQHPAIRLFVDLLAVPAPPGREEQLAGVICDKLDGWGITHQVDPAGNVLVRIEGQEPEASLCCLAAHMDEIAVVVNRVEPDGTLRVERLGGLHPWKLGEGPIQILGDCETVLGIVSLGSGHVPGAASQVVTWQEARVLTGVSPERLAVAGVRPGSTAVPIREGRGPFFLGDATDPLVAAWTFDDRMGVVALLRLLETMTRESIRPRRPTLVAFTVHEEDGSFGAKALALREQPEVFIALDGCPMPPGAPLLLDGRPGVWSKDRLAPYDHRLLGALGAAARRAGTELQPVVYDTAASDASLVYAAGGAYRIACFGHVRDNSHGFEVSRLSVFDNVWRTLVEFVRGWED
jgi:putative aminopeptidase FrvX